MHTFFTTLLSNLLFAVRSSRSGKDIKESTLETQADAQLDWPTGLLRWELISESPNQVGVELVRFARRTGHEIEVIFIDLDCFGEVNKKLGHDTGDRILSHLGTAVKGNLRAMDLAFQKGDQTLIISVGSGHVHTLMGRVQTAYATLVDSDSVLAALRSETCAWPLPPQEFSYGHQVLHPVDECDPKELLDWAKKEADTRMSLQKGDKKRYRCEGKDTAIAMEYGRPATPTGFVSLSERGNPFIGIS